MCFLETPFLGWGIQLPSDTKFQDGIYGVPRHVFSKLWVIFSSQKGEQKSKPSPRQLNKGVIFPTLSLAFRPWNQRLTQPKDHEIKFTL